MNQRRVSVAMLLFVLACNRSPQPPREVVPTEQATPPEVSEPTEQAQDKPADDDYEKHWHAGSVAHASGELPLALGHFTSAVEANPKGLEARLTRGVVNQELGCWKAALADYEASREIAPDDFAAWNNIAMLLAACPDDSMRDGDKAAEYALNACKLTDWKHPAVVNTLAIAYAEQGEWKYAVDHANMAINNASIIEGSEVMIEDFRVVLKLFEKKQPYRIPVVEPMSDEP